MSPVGRDHRSDFSPPDLLDSRQSDHDSSLYTRPFKQHTRAHEVHRAANVLSLLLLFMWFITSTTLWCVKFALVYSEHECQRTKFTRQGQAEGTTATNKIHDVFTAATRPRCINSVPGCLLQQPPPPRFCLSVVCASRQTGISLHTEFMTHC